MPDAGYPLYKVSDPFEAKFISSIRRKRYDIEASSKKSIHTLDKKLIKVDRREKRRLYSGDQMGVLSQLDLLDESDITSMKKQLSKEISMAEQDTKNRIGKTRRRTLRTERLQNMLQAQGDNPLGDEELLQEDIEYREEQKQIFGEIFKADTTFHQPLIIKAPSSGALETVLKEVNKLIRGCEKISIIESGVGPINEFDVQTAEQTGAYLFGFDVSFNDQTETKAYNLGVIGRTYKLIFKMTDEIKKLVGDMNINVDEIDDFEEIASANVQQTFIVKSSNTKNAVKLVVAGLSVKTGTINKSFKASIYRNEELLEENLEIESLKVHSKEAAEVKAGDECGIRLKNFNEYKEGDIIKFMKPIQKEKVFNYSKGIITV